MLRLRYLSGELLDSHSGSTLEKIFVVRLRDGMQEILRSCCEDTSKVAF